MYESSLDTFIPEEYVGQELYRNFLSCMENKICNKHKKNILIHITHTCTTIHIFASTVK